MIFSAFAAVGLGADRSGSTRPPEEATIPATQAAGLPKQVFASYFPHHRTREHDGNLGSWWQSRTAKGGKADKTHYNFDADLVDENGRHQIASTVYPLVGMQSDLDPDYQEYQVLLAKTAHIDAFIVDWVLPGRSTWEIGLKSLRETARKYGLKIGVDFIASSYFKWIGNYRPDLKTREKKVEGYKECVQYMLDQFYSHETALRVNGHPLIFLFGGARPEEFRRIKSHPYRLPPGLKEPWFVLRARVGPKWKHTRYGYRQWAGILEGMFGWIALNFRLTGKPIPPEMQRIVDGFIDSDDAVEYQKRVTIQNDRYFRKGFWKIRINSACPGFDNRGCAGWGETLRMLPRENGETYRKQWQWIVENRDRIDAVLCVTWNDYTEATSVEPTVEHGLRDLLMTERYTAAFKGIESDPSGVPLPVELFRLRKKQRFFEAVGLATGGLARKLDEAALAISRSDYKTAERLLKQASELARRTGRAVRSEKIVVKFPGPRVRVAVEADEQDGVYAVSKRQGLCLRFDEQLAKRLRSEYFQGILEFEYLNVGGGRFRVKAAPARPDVPGERNVAQVFSEVCRIEKDDTGKWVKAKVKLFKANTGLNHTAANGSDFAFEGEVKIRNITFAFEVFRRR